jgi:hypothetical protein
MNSCSVLVGLIVLSLLLGCTSSRSAKRTQSPDPDFHLYLLVGQSNMAGRGEVDAESKEVHPQVFMLTKENQWVPAADPLHFDKPPVVGVGPGLAFGREMAAKSPGTRIGLIPCAVGGSPIAVWQAGKFYEPTGTHPYDDALARAKVAQQQGVLKGIIWHQGESDSSPDMAAGYLPKLEQLIQTFRRDLSSPEVPVVVGELGYYRDQYQNINHQLRQLPERVPRTAVASAQGLVHKGDGTHFDTGSARTLGQRFAEKMAELQRER